MAEFVTLDAWLRQPAPSIEIDPSSHDDEPVADPPAAPEEEDAIADVASRARRFRAMLTDALERSLADLLRDIAAEVIGRELQCAPAELQRIVERALARAADELPVSVHVHPLQLELLRLDLPLVADARLHCDDVRIELRSGTIDASLGVRLEQLLAVYGA
jgi:flagellar biosynthesis/type III secretory pathway protein FliH